MTQRTVVERILRESGEVRVHTLIYRFGITRAAAVIEELRKDGWDIETLGGQGELATYRLRSAAAPQRSAARPETAMERAMREHFHREEAPAPQVAVSLVVPCGCVRSADGRRWDSRCAKHQIENKPTAAEVMEVGW